MIYLRWYTWILLVVAIAYAVSPLDLFPGPVDDGIVAIGAFGVKMLAQRVFG